MLKIASIGAGGRGGIVHLAHNPAEGSTLVAACDRRPDVRKHYTEKYPGIAFFDDYRQLLAHDKYDAVFVTTPDFLHEEMGVAALETGAAVYLEKPMAITLAGCDKLLAASAKHGNRLFVGHNMRFFPVIEKMKEIILSGRIGQVQAIWCRHFIDYGGDAYFKDWHSERRFATGMLLQKGAHDIDVIHHLAGAHTVRTVGMGKLSVYDRVTNRRPEHQPGVARFEIGNWPPLKQTNLSPIIDVEDHSMVLMQLANGVQASYQQCHYTPDGWRNYCVIGDAGRIENWGDYSGGETVCSVRVFEKRRSGWYNGDEEVPVPAAEGSHGGADPRIVADFLRFTRTGVNKGATPWDARQSVAVGYLATASMRNGNIPFDVPPLGKATV